MGSNAAHGQHRMRVLFAPIGETRHVEQRRSLRQGDDPHFANNSDDPAQRLRLLSNAMSLDGMSHADFDSAPGIRRSRHRRPIDHSHAIATTDSGDSGQHSIEDRQQFQIALTSSAAQTAPTVALPHRD